MPTTQSRQSLAQPTGQMRHTSSCWSEFVQYWALRQLCSASLCRKMNLHKIPLKQHLLIKTAHFHHPREEKVPNLIIIQKRWTKLKLSQLLNWQKATITSVLNLIRCFQKDAHKTQLSNWVPLRLSKTFWSLAQVRLFSLMDRLAQARLTPS